MTYKREREKYMNLKIALVVPNKDDAMSEIKKMLTIQEADIYIFPEGFLSEGDLDYAVEISQTFNKFIISGLVLRTESASCQKAVIIDNGKIIGEYQKNILSQAEKAKGRAAGSSIYCIESKYGIIGIPICYEIHFPEVARVMSLENPCCLVNLIGTGMYNDLQYEQWLALARARAIENEVYVFGCSHYNGTIPIAYAIAPDGRVIGESRNSYGCIIVNVDLEKSFEKKYMYLRDRLPDRFVKLSD